MFHRSPTPTTSLDSIPGSLSQSYGITAACSTSSSSIFAHAFARASLPTIGSAASIALLIFGMFTCPQLGLPEGEIVLPLNGTCNTAWPSPKSATQPTFGQTSISSAGTPQYFEYMTD